MEQKDKLQQVKLQLVVQARRVELLLHLLECIPQELGSDRIPQVNDVLISLTWHDPAGRPVIHVTPDRDTGTTLNVCQGSIVQLSGVGQATALQAVRSVLDQVDTPATRQLAEELRRTLHKNNMHYGVLFSKLCPFANKYPNLRVYRRDRHVDSQCVFEIVLERGKEIAIFYDEDEGHNPYSFSDGAEKFL